MRGTFREPATQDAFTRLGHVTIDLFTADEVAALQALVDELFVGDEAGFHSSTESADHGYRDRLFHRLVPLVQAHVDRLFADHVLLNAAILVKFPGDDGAMGAHQDWSFVDEDRFRSLNVWVPLVDVEVGNGALAVLPGSHRVLRHTRTSPRLPATYDDPVNGLTADDLTTVALRAGQAVVTDHGVVHASPPNHTGDPRPVVAFALVPREAALHHHFALPDGTVEHFRVPDAAWFRTFDMGVRPQGLELASATPHDGAGLSTAELIERSRRAAAPPRRWARLLRRRSAPVDVWGPARDLAPSIVDGADVAAPVAATPVAATPRPPAPVVEREPTFTDPGLEAAFRADGVVVVDLLDAPGVAATRDRFAELEHELHGDSPFAQGFHTTLYDGRADYRLAVRQVIEGALRPRLDALLVDHQVLFANFVTKLAGGEAVPHHLDWTFVDEDRFASVTVWCPLEDTDAHNGTLGVVVRSHDAVDFIRPVNRRDYEMHAAVSDGVEELYPLQAGQALVMDNRMVHFSPPNRSDATRVVAACVVAPRQAPIVHHWVDDEEQLFRLELERDFFLSYDIGSDPREVTGVRQLTPVAGARYG